MGWRLRRSFRIFPGVRWNLGLRGTSWSVGPRGFKLNFSKRGIRQTVSLPGTGISHSQMLGGREKSSKTKQISTSRLVGSSSVPPAPHTFVPKPELDACSVTYGDSGCARAFAHPLCQP
jgi:hypothetical protein